MNRSQQICEAVDGFLLRPSIRDQFYKEKNRFQRQSNRTPVSHMTRVARELTDAQNFDPATNPWTIPTIGSHARENFFDPNPSQRWSPVFQRRMGKTHADESFSEAKGRNVGGKPKGNPLPPSYTTKRAPSQPGPPRERQERPEKPGRQEQVQQQQQQGQEQDVEQQQQQMQQQQQEVPQGTVSPQDAMQGQPGQVDQQQPQLPELPADLRRDPEWIGNQPNKMSPGLQSSSQKIVDRYSVETDPLRRGGPRTNSYRQRMLGARWGDRSQRLLRNSRTPPSNSGNP